MGQDRHQSLDARGAVSTYSRQSEMLYCDYPPAFFLAPFCFNLSLSVSLCISESIIIITAYIDLYTYVHIYVCLYIYPFISSDACPLGDFVIERESARACERERERESETETEIDGERERETIFTLEYVNRFASCP